MQYNKSSLFNVGWSELETLDDNLYELFSDNKYERKNYME